MQAAAPRAPRSPSPMAAAALAAAERPGTGDARGTPVKYRAPFEGAIHMLM